MRENLYLLYENGQWHSKVGIDSVGGYSPISEVLAIGLLKNCFVTGIQYIDKGQVFDNADACKHLGVDPSVLISVF